MAKRRNRISELGELQLEVLGILDRLGEATVYDVLDQFPEDRRPRYTTVLTVLRRLDRKGLATYRTRERTHVFRSSGGAQKARHQVLREVLDRVFGGSPQDLMAALLDVGAATPEVLDELQALIAARGGADDGQ
jgi:predicted transcriptional regulator